MVEFIEIFHFSYRLLHGGAFGKHVKGTYLDLHSFEAVPQRLPLLMVLS